MLNLVRKPSGETYVNTQKGNAQSRQAVAALPGGGFVVVWADESLTGGDSSVGSVKGQLYDAAGAKVGGEFLVNSFTSDKQHEPSVAVLASGGFVVTWTNEEDTIALGGDSSASSVKGQIFTAAAAKVGGEFQVNGYDSSAQCDSHVFALPNGGFVATWWDVGTFNIFAHVFDAAGNRAPGPDILVSNTGTGIQFEPVGVAYGPNRFVIMWTNQNFGPNISRGVDGQIFDLAGNKIGAEFPVSTTIPFVQTTPDVAALAGGGFVAAWATNEQENWAKAQIFNAAGAKVGGEILVSSPSNNATQVSVTALAWGGFMVAWENVGNNSTTERGQLFDAQGNKVGAEFQINAEPGVFGGFIDLATLASGEVAAVWTNENGATSEQMGIKLQLLLLPVAGTAGPDSLNGTAGDDAIAGLAGDDEISGAAGADLIEGDGGNDSLDGGADDDQLDGGGGDDVVFGGTGNDSIEGGAGVDLLHGLAGNDFLSGGNGNDLLRGYDGVDHYEGGGDDGLNTDGAAYGDRISFLDSRATQGVVADLRTGIISNDGYGNAETMAGIESLTGDTAYVDTYYGDDSSNGLWAGLGDSAYGFGGSDVFVAGSAPALVDGGAGTDLLRVSSTGVAYRPDSNGNGIAEIAPPMTSGWFVDLAAGTIVDGYGNSGSVTGIENVLGSALGDDLRGNGGVNRLEGGAGNDTLWLDSGGADVALGGDGNDAFLYGHALTNGDVANGGAGTDQLGMQGDYTGSSRLTFGFVTNIEQIILLAGDDTRFGDPGTHSYSYDLTTHNVNVAAGQLLSIDANKLRAGENLTFNGAAELDGSFLIWAGKGVDILSGGAGGDGFLFRGNGNWGSSDRVDGGGGNDQVGIRGDYDGANAIVMGSAQLANVETLIFMSGADTRFGPAVADADYDVTMNNGNVASGRQLTVDAGSLQAGETFVFNGTDETDGSYRIFGGQGADTITGSANADTIRGGLGGDTLAGGGGADLFVYRNAGESTGTGFDTLTDLATSDRIDLPTAVSGWAAAVTGGQLNDSSFNADLAAALDGPLGPGQAVLFTASTGDRAGQTFLVVDGNNDGAYVQGQDYVFLLGPTATVDTSSTALFV